MTYGDLWTVGMISKFSTLTRGRVLRTKRMASAMSSGISESTPSYTVAARSASPRKRTRENSVATIPGSTEDIRTLVPIRSTLIPSVSARTAYFVAQ